MLMKGKIKFLHKRVPHKRVPDTLFKISGLYNKKDK